MSRDRVSLAWAVFMVMVFVAIAVAVLVQPTGGNHWPHRQGGTVRPVCLPAGAHW